MADVNGDVKEDKVETLSDEKVDVNGGGDNASNPVSEENKESKEESKEELDPETRAKKIKRQIEYYFGDFNLPSDKFLREQVKLKEGWVPIETLLKFRRLASFTQDPAVIVEALSGSELVQINEDKTEIRRNPEKPLPEESEARRKEILERSVYVKGFPQEGFTIDNALDFFENYGPTDDIVMRFWHDKAADKWCFKGSVFAKFSTKDAGAAFVALEDLKYKDTPLIKMWQTEYLEKKRNERLEQRSLKRKRPGREDTKEKQEEERTLPKDATLHMTKIPEGLSRELVKDKLEEMGVVVAFIDFNKGDQEGWIRLHEAGSAANVIEACQEGILKLKEGIEVELRPLTGEEEAKFLESAKQNINARRAKGNKHKQGRRGGSRGGGRGGGRGGHWRKRKHDNNSEEPQEKLMKTEGSDDDGE